MIVDAERVPTGELPPFDLCIVGAGAAGITLAQALIRTGLRICILESGGRKLEPGPQALADGHAEGQPYFPLIETRARCFGGSTIWWNGECRPLDPAQDLQARPWLGDAGWPIPPSELHRHYPQAQELCSLGPEPFDPPDPWLADAGLAALPLDPDRWVTRLFRYAPVLDFAAAFGARLRRATNVTVLLHAHVAAIEVSADAGRATGLLVKRRNGPRFRLAAPLIVLAAGGIENARLLLASRLGNGHDLVGRHFMEHLFLDDAARLVPTRPVRAFRPYYRRMSLRGRDVKATLAPTATLLAAEGLPNFAIKLASAAKRQLGMLALLALRDGLRQHRPGERPLAAVRALLADLPGTARALAAVAAGRETGAGGAPVPLLVSVVGEQTPDPASRVTLSERRDAFGEPLARLDWRVAERDRLALWRVLELLAAEAGRSGLGRLDLPGDAGRELALARLRGGRHHMGTTRMGVRPSQGVVDPDCRVHGIPNLFVAGSSVFPTAGHANPTLTIVALALRLADTIARDAPALLHGQRSAVDDPG